MAQEIQILRWCDACMDDGLKTPAEPYVIAVAGGEPRQIDLCADHSGPFTQVEMMITKWGQLITPDDRPAKARMGRPPGPNPDAGLNRHGLIRMPDGSTTTSNTTEARTCPECGHVSPTRSASQGHLRRMHGFTWTQYLARARGEVAPKRRSPSVPVGEESTRTCSVCGFVSTTRSALAQHTNAVHGVRLRDLAAVGSPDLLTAEA